MAVSGNSLSIPLILGDAKSDSKTPTLAERAHDQIQQSRATYQRAAATFQRFATSNRSVNTDLAIDTKYSPLNATDNDIVIQINTSQADHYRSILESSANGLEEKSADYIQDLIDSLESALDNSRKILKIKEENKKKYELMLAASIRDANRLKVNREDAVRTLRSKQKVLNTSISLLQKGINKRKQPIQFLMYGIMFFTSAYLVENLFEYILYKRQVDKSINSLDMNLQNNITLFESQITLLSNQSTLLQELYPQLVNISNSVFSTLIPIIYSWYCNNPFYPWDPNNPTGNGPCSNRISFNEPWDHGPQDANACYNFWPYGSVGVNAPDPCLTAINNYIQIMQNVTENAAETNDIATEINSLNLNINSSLAEIAALAPDYSGFYDWVNNPLTYYLIFSICGVFAPGAIIAMTLLTNVFNNCSVSPRRRFDVSEAEHKQLIDTADQYNIAYAQLSYSMLIKNFKDEVTVTMEQLARFDGVANLRMAFLSGMKETDAKEAPIFKLFHGTDSKGYKGCEPKIVTKIFAFAGISVTQLDKQAKRAARTTFECGAHPKNGTPVAQPDGNLKFAPLFNFFNRLSNEEAEFKTQRSPGEFLLFKQLTNEKKFNAQGGKAYHQGDVLRNIYEFAGLIPKSKTLN